MRLIAVLWLSHCNWCTAQIADSIPDSPAPEKKYYLVLDKPGKVSRLRFYTGSRIAFKLTGEKQLYSGVITAIRKNAIVVHYTDIPLSEIFSLKVPQRARFGRILSGFGSGLRGVGSLFFLVGAANFVLKPQDRENSRVTAQSGLSAFLVGQTFKIFNKRNYKLNKNRRLKTIQLI